MSHPLYDVVEFEQIDTYTLRFRFDDRTEQIIDFEPVLYGEVFGVLREPALFAQVHRMHLRRRNRGISDPEWAGCPPRNDCSAGEHEPARA